MNAQIRKLFVLIVLPQRRQRAAHRALVQSLEVGIEVMTTSGIFGTIIELDESVAKLEIAPGVIIRVARGAISQRVAAPAA